MVVDNVKGRNGHANNFSVCFMKLCITKKKQNSNKMFARMPVIRQQSHGTDSFQTPLFKVNISSLLFFF